MADGEYVPSSDEDRDPSSMDAVVFTASPPTSSSSPRQRRKRRCCTVSSAVPCVLVYMDTSEVKVLGHKQCKTFRGVWEDVVSWEEHRARKPHYGVTVTLPEPSSTPSPNLLSLFLLLILLWYLRIPLFHLLFLQMALCSILCRPLLLRIRVVSFLTATTICHAAGRCQL